MPFSRALLLVQLVGDGVRVDAALVDRMLRALPVYSLAIADVPLATLISRNCTVTPVGGLPDACRRARRPRPAPSSDRAAPDRSTCGCGIVAIGVARDHVELFFELQIVPQDLADRLRGGLGLGVAGQRDERRHRDLRRQAGIAGADSHPDLALLLALRRRRRRAVAEQRDRAAGAEATTTAAGRQDREVISAENRKSDEPSASSR